MGRAMYRARQRRKTDYGWVVDMKSESQVCELACLSFRLASEQSRRQPRSVVGVCCLATALGQCAGPATSQTMASCQTGKRSDH